MFGVPTCPLAKASAKQILLSLAVSEVVCTLICELFPACSDWSCAQAAEMMGQRFLWLLWACTCCWSTGFCGKVVVWPTDASHWINIKVLLEELVLRGHEVTVLVPSSNLLINYEDTSSPFTFEVLQVPYSQEFLNAVMEDFLNLWMNELPNLFPWEVMWRMTELIGSFSDMSKQTCDTLVTNPQLMAKLQQAKFDVLIADPLAVGGELVAQLLEIPFVYTFRFSDGNVAERLCGGLPSPPSYVPASTVGMTDQMSFVERLRNFLFYLYTDLFFLKFWRDEWDGYYSNVLGKAAAEQSLLHRLCLLNALRAWCYRITLLCRMSHSYADDLLEDVVPR